MRLSGTLLLIATLLCAFGAPALGAPTVEDSLRADPESASFSQSWPPGGVPLFDLPDTIKVEARRHGYGVPQVELLYDYLQPSDPGSLGLRPSEFALRPRTMELSRFGTTMYGADLGGALALNLGGVGHFLGLWDEKTAFTIMGAGAALGAIWGGTLGNENSKFRIRIDTRPEDR